MPTPEELLHTLVEEAGEDPIAKAGTVSVAQAERELGAAGFDVKAERARASDVIVELTGAGEVAGEPGAWVSAPPPPEGRTRSPRSVVWLAVALAAAATTGGILYAVAHRPKPPEQPLEGPPVRPSASAAAPPPSPVAPPGATPTGRYDKGGKPAVDEKVPSRGGGKGGP